jgi:hypothetical protein
MKHLIKILFLKAIFTIHMLAANASPLSLTLSFGDYLLREGASELLGAHGVNREAMGSVRQSVENSLNTLMPNQNQVNIEQLKNAIRNLPLMEEDKATQAQLLERLDQRAANLQYDDMVETINIMIYLSNRYGARSSTLMTCTSCTQQAARQAGFRFAVESLQAEHGSSLLAQSIPNGPRELNQYISRLLTKHNLGSLRAVTKEMLPSEDERSFALFLTMIEQGSPAQKAFAQEVLEISRNPQTSNIELFNIDNSHSLWKILTWNLNDDSLLAMRRVLMDANAEGANQVSKEDAFFRVLEKMHAGDEKSLEHVAALRTNNCLFR